MDMKSCRCPSAPTLISETSKEVITKEYHVVHSPWSHHQSCKHCTDYNHHQSSMRKSGIDIANNDLPDVQEYKNMRRQVILGCTS